MPLARTARPLLAALVPALLLGTLAGPASPALAADTTLPGVLTTSSSPGRPGTADAAGDVGAQSGPTVSRSAGPLAVPVPAGVQPSAITGVLTMPEVAAGATVTMVVNGRDALSVPATLYDRVRVPVTAADVVADGTIGLSVRYDAAPGATSCTPAPGVTVRKLGLTYTGTETAPTTVADFFPAAVSRVDVRVAPDSADDVLQAALNAVAALSHRYPGDTPVELSTDDEPLPAAGAGHRVVQLVGEGTDVTATVGAAEGTVPALTLTGSGLPLSAAARALGGEELVLADGDEVEGLTRQVESRAEGATRTLTQLRSDLASPTTAVLQPDPPGTVTLPLRQDSWGSAVRGYRVHLEGTHSAVPEDAEARLDVFLDDELVGSQQLTGDAGIDLDVTLPGGVLRPENQLRATITSTDDAALLCAPGLPLDLALDEDASTVTARRGDGVARGFAALPQVFGGRLEVALRQDGDVRYDDAEDAATLVSAMQRVGAAPFDVQVVDPDLLVTGDEPGILVGAGTEDAQRLGAPLQLSGDRSLDVTDTRFAVTAAQPFAALEAVGRRRHLLLLGSWQPGGLQADPELSHRLLDRVLEDGWAELDGDVAFTGSTGAATVVDSGAPAVESAAEDEEGRTSYLGWFALAIGLLLALLAVQVVRALRRDRRAREAAQADEPARAEEPDQPAERP